MDAAWVAAWAAVATAVIYVVLGAFAFVQLAESRRLRQEQARPYVIVDFAFRQFLIYIEIKNAGKTPARKVDISFDKQLESANANFDPAERAVFEQPIPMLAPGRSIRIYFDVAPDRFAREDLPRSYVVTCKYEDLHGHRYNDPPGTLDLTPYYGAALEPKGLPELVSEVERLRKELAKWTDGSRGLLVQSVDREKSMRRRDRWHWRRTARSLRDREGNVAWLRWFAKRWLRRYGWVR